MSKCPVNGGTPGNCLWYRKLCVTCFSDSTGGVFMRIQTNGLPDHCLPIPTNSSLEEKIIDIQFVYSPVPKTIFRKPLTVDELNVDVCDFD